MVRRHSSGNRLERLRAEAAATEREKEQKRKAKAAAGPAPAKKKRTRATATETVRMMAVWAVCDPRGDAVSTFGFAERAAAEQECERLNSTTGKTHMVQRQRVPFE